MQVGKPRAIGADLEHRAKAMSHRVLPDKITRLPDLSPTLPIEAVQVGEPVPSVLRANTAPAPELPPIPAVPYNVLPDKISRP
jgi:hypothetical protein